MEAGFGTLVMCLIIVQGAVTSASYDHVSIALVQKCLEECILVNLISFFSNSYVFV